MLPLRTSWRNDHAILDIANTTSGPLRSELVAPLRARPDAGIGRVHAARLVTTEEEAAYVADWVAARWRSPSGRRTKLSAAVLCRKRAQFPLVVEALKARDLPVEVVGLGGLLLTPEVNDLVSLLWVVQDPSRGDRLMRLLTGPFCRLGPADLDGLASWARVQQRTNGALPGEAQVLQLPGLETAPDEDFEEAGEFDPSSRGSDESGLVRHPAQGEVRDQAPESSDRASIVEALDDLPPAAWRGTDGQRVSEAGLLRLRALGHVVKELRRLTGLPLAELVGEGERALGLDIEVLARPEHTVATARAHLDAFAEVAATFSASADRPTLGGFLAWLDAAIEQERGLDAPTIETSLDAVQVLTVHAAKGLEWDCVAVPGLVEASFPAREGGAPSSWKGDHWEVSELKDKGWCVGADGVPYDLRGDADGLPRLHWRDAVDWEALVKDFSEFALEGGRHATAEERRLAYVAFTRARSELLLTAPVWADAATPKVTSQFLEELVDAPGLVRGPWADMPVADEQGKAVNPRLVEPVRHPWPDDPLALRREQLAGGVELVASALVSPANAAPVDAETEAELDLLLAERAEASARREVVVEVPRHLSASDVVQLATDQTRFALSLRRPMPAAPALAARRGTAFHAWVEQHYHRAAMVDVLDLPGSADETAPDEITGAELARMKELFLASEWADRVPEAVEIAVETVLDGFAIRGRIDAVFPRDGWRLHHRRLEDRHRARRPRRPAPDAAARRIRARVCAAARPPAPRRRRRLLLRGDRGDGAAGPPAGAGAPHAPGDRPGLARDSSDGEGPARHGGLARRLHRRAGRRRRRALRLVRRDVRSQRRPRGGGGRVDRCDRHRARGLRPG